MSSILPNGENISTAPNEVLRYLDTDGLRQLLRQERAHWNLKPNRDADYYSKITHYKYSSDLHNDGDHQRMEVRTFPDNGANPGYAYVHTDGGEFGVIHNNDKWDHAQSDESKKAITQRVQIGVTGTRDGADKYGLENEKVVEHSNHVEASILFDSHDARAYLYSGDDPAYTNNEKRDPAKKLPLRTLARVGDIPTRITDLENDLDFVADWDYHHTDNNYTHSNRYLTDNMDDRTFVYPEISQDSEGNYIDNSYIGLSGDSNYSEGDGTNDTNSQPEIGDNNDRNGAANNSYNKNKGFSGVNHPNGYLPGIFKSFEELQKVDLLRQKRTSLHSATPGGRRRQNYYQFDGIWDYDRYDRDNSTDAYAGESLNPYNMETYNDTLEPFPYNVINQDTQYNTNLLYQWRYNRISVYWESKNLKITIIEPGVNYKVGDLLRYTFTDEVLTYRVDEVNADGAIMDGHYVIPSANHKFEQNPSSNGVGIPFSDYVSSGRHAKLAIQCKASIYTNATQIKNNLYAYVDVVPSVRSDNEKNWSDINHPPDLDLRMPPRTIKGRPIGYNDDHMDISYASFIEDIIGMIAYMIQISNVNGELPKELTLDDYVEDGGVIPQKTILVNPTDVASAPIDVTYADFTMSVIDDVIDMLKFGHISQPPNSPPDIPNTYTNEELMPPKSIKANPYYQYRSTSFDVPYDDFIADIISIIAYIIRIGEISGAIGSPVSVSDYYNAIGMQPPDLLHTSVVPRSTAPSPAYSGINSGAGGDVPDTTELGRTFYEHGGNATAGPHIHIFHYVINTENPTYEIVDGVKVYTGEWVDQGPLSLERACDIKALLFSNPDCNNFNNYYKFSIDSMLSNLTQNPDRVSTGNPYAFSQMYIHINQTDPIKTQKFYDRRINPITAEITAVDITDRVLYVNMARAKLFIYNTNIKRDPETNETKQIGWVEF